MRLIDADALMIELNNTKYAWQDYDSVEDALRNIPTIEAEPVRHGYWMCGDYYDIGDVCSECDWDSGMVNPTLRYCPNCGAKMDKEE